MMAMKAFSAQLKGRVSKMGPNRRSARLLLPVLMAILFPLTGCEDRDPDEGGVSDTTASYDLSFPTPSFADGRTLDTLFSVDLDDDGQREYVVTSIVRDGVIAPGGRADQVEIYRFDTLSRSWKRVVVDTLLWGVSYTLREMTGDRAPEIIAQVIAGGNDPIASNGMHIYSGDGGTIRTIFSRDDGDPQIGTLEGTEHPVVILHDLIWPPLVPHVQSVPYVADLLAFDGKTMASVGSQHAEYFRKQADALLAEYAKELKDAKVADTEMVGDNGLADAELPDGTLFATAAQAMIALDQAGQPAALRTFWKGEQDTLRVVLPGEQYDQLEELYAEKIMR